MEVLHLLKEIVHFFHISAQNCVKKGLILCACEILQTRGWYQNGHHRNYSWRFLDTLLVRAIHAVPSEQKGTAVNMPIWAKESMVCLVITAQIAETVGEGCRKAQFPSCGLQEAVGLGPAAWIQHLLEAPGASAEVPQYAHVADPGLHRALIPLYSTTRPEIYDFAISFNITLTDNIYLELLQLR